LWITIPYWLYKSKQKGNNETIRMDEEK